MRLATPLACVLPLQASLVMTMSLHHTILHSTLSPLQHVITMTTPRAQEAKRETLNLRIKPEERCLIDRAAQLLGKNRTDFMLDATRRAAVEAILDQTIFAVSPEAHAEFLARLDAPPQPNERLRKALQTPAPWE